MLALTYRCDSVCNFTYNMRTVNMKLTRENTEKLFSQSCSVFTSLLLLKLCLTFVEKIVSSDCNFKCAKYSVLTELLTMSSTHTYCILMLTA